jgi:hypothetical protein
MSAWFESAKALRRVGTDTEKKIGNPPEAGDKLPKREIFHKRFFGVSFAT